MEGKWQFNNSFNTKNSGMHVALHYHQWNHTLNPVNMAEKENKKHRIINCKGCKKPKKYYAKNFCSVCYHVDKVNSMNNKKEYHII